MNMIGLEAQRRGAEAEKRVQEIAIEMGFNVYYLEQLDFGNKTDLVIEGVKVQISCKPKSMNQIKLLQRRGIHCIIAGENILDDSIKQQIYSLFNNEQ